MKYLILFLVSITASACYVERDGSGNVKGVYMAAQPGYATEWMDDKDATVVAFKQKVADILSGSARKAAISAALTSLQTDITNVNNGQGDAGMLAAHLASYIAVQNGQTPIQTNAVSSISIPIKPVVIGK